ncbi:unnamed protein product [Sphagnum jensenii]
MSDTFRIAIIGDAYGETEEQYRLPFVGAAGQELTRILTDAGISRSHCFITNTFNLRPARNDIETFCVPKSSPDRIPGRGPFAPGKYFRQEYYPEIARLYSELEAVRPNVAVLLGNTACWALLDRTSISKIRGTVSYSPILPWLKCLPTYHPAAILRQYDLRHVTVLDFVKAKLESEFPEVRRPRREIWIEPKVEEIHLFKKEYIDGCKVLSFDIETAFEEITCIGFSPSIDRALVIPFVDTRKPGCNYFQTFEEELSAWSVVADILSGPEPKVGQNGLYDIQYLWMKYGIPVNNYCEDTMLLHHSLFPESPKGLDFLGSVYTNEAAWKTERPRGKHTIKREDE